MQQQAEPGARRFPPPLRMLPKVALLIWGGGLFAGLFGALASEPLQAPRQLLSWVLLSLDKTPASAQVTQVTPNWGRGGIRSHDVHYVFRSPDGTERRHVQRILAPQSPSPAGRVAPAGRVDIHSILDRDVSFGTMPTTNRIWHSPLLPGLSAIHFQQLGTYCYKQLLLMPLLLATFFTLWSVGLVLIAHAIIRLSSRWRGAVS